jgi:hypothetical protein
LFGRLLKLGGSFVIRQGSPPFRFVQPLHPVYSFEYRALAAQHFHIMAGKTVGHGHILLIWQSQPTPFFAFASLQWCGHFVEGKWT